MNARIEPPFDAKRRLTLALINQLGFPGVGTVMAGRKIGYAQAAVMLVGLVITLVYIYQLAQDLAPLFVQMKPVSQDELMLLYKQHIRVGQLGLVVSLAAWSWSLVSSIAILRERQ